MSTSHLDTHVRFLCTFMGSAECAGWWTLQSRTWSNPAWNQSYVIGMKSIMLECSLHVVALEANCYVRLALSVEWSNYLESLKLLHFFKRHDESFSKCSWTYWIATQKIVNCFLLIQMDISLYMHLKHRPRLSWFSRSILPGKLDELYEINLKFERLAKSSVDCSCNSRRLRNTRKSAEIRLWNSSWLL